MIKNKTTRKRRKSRHFNLDDRIKIASGLSAGDSIRSIAKELDVSPSSVSREIFRNSIIKKRPEPRCMNYRQCVRKNLCKNCPTPYKVCKNCKTVQCPTKCGDFSIPEDKCPKNLPACNACSRKNGFVQCNYSKRIYSAKAADNNASLKATESRNGFNLTGEQFARIDEIASPLLKKGQSPYTIINNHPELGISVQTLYRLIAHRELRADNFSLRCKVNRKPRKGFRLRKMNREVISKLKGGRRYEDYLAFIETYDGPVVQMDTVIGKRDEGASLLTLHMPTLHFQVAVMLDEHTSDAVVNALDMIEITLGYELFNTVFTVLLTDNGSEFMDIQGMERSCIDPSKKRTMVFFCEPNRSDQKGAAENNHKYIRYVIPKGTSLEPYSQSDINLMMYHINSYARKSLYGKTPFQVAKSVLPEDFFMLMGYEEIPADQVDLTPKLLKNRISQR